MPKKWMPLESNPDVLNEFGANIGLDTARFQFHDVFGLDEELLAMVPQPVSSVIMCFPITEASDAFAKEEDAAASQATSSSTDPPFYLKQTIGNACGTIAVIHAACNNQQTLSQDPDTFLRRFYEATKNMSPHERGTYLEEPPQGAPDIEGAHQAAAAEGVSSVPNPEADIVLHFVAFIHKNGRLWQLDGRRTGPVDNGPTTPETLLADTVKVVQTFVERSNSVQFNLIALATAEA